MAVSITQAPAAPLNPRYASGCRGCGTSFEFDESDAERERDGQNHRLTLACPTCGARLQWTLAPMPLTAAPARSAP